MIERLGKYIRELLLGVNLHNLNTISTILDVGSEPMNLAVVELRARRGLPRIGIGENESSTVIFPDGGNEVSGAILVQSGSSSHYSDKVAKW